MIRSNRAFLVLTLLALVGAATLHVLVLSGVGRAWGAMVHLTLFGWVTGMITTITYHTTPVFTARDFPQPRLAWIHLGVLSVGLILAISGLLLSIKPLTLVGIGVEVAAAVLFTVNIITLVFRGVPRAQRPTPPPIANQPQVDRIATQATRSACLYLPLALLLLLASEAGWMGGDWVLAAEHLAALGWIMLTVVGVAYHMLPRFNGRGVRGPSWVRLQLVCHQVSLALMVPALGLGLLLLFAVGGLIMAGSLGLFAWTVWPALNRQRMPVLTISLLPKERPQ